MRTNCAKNADTADSEPLLAAARRQIASLGLNAVSARAVAAACNISPASINHRFGDKAGLITAALNSAIDLDVAALNMIADEISNATIPASRRADVLHHVISRQFVEHRVLATIRWNVFVETMRTGAYREVSRRWAESQAHFWRTTGKTLGLQPESTMFAYHTAEHFGRGYLISTKPLLFDGWCKDFSCRLIERLSCEDLSFADDSPWRQAFIESEPKTSRPANVNGAEKVEQLINAAVRVIIQKGAASMTHRSVAKEAGVSLSATTYYFASLDDIYVKTYQNLVEEVISSNAYIKKHKKPAEKRSLSLVAADLSKALSDIWSGEASDLTYAIAELDLLAASKPELRSLSDVLLARIGATSTNILRSIEGAPRDIDALDGVILSRYLNGLNEGMQIKNDANALSLNIRHGLEAFLSLGVVDS
ncbi:MAG: TetR family transcriptional regulator [Pseudomonadota bacterium]